MANPLCKVFASHISLVNSKGIKQTVNVDEHKAERAHIYIGDGLNDDTVVYEAEEETYIYLHCTVTMYTPRED